MVEKKTAVTAKKIGRVGEEDILELEFPDSSEIGGDKMSESDIQKVLNEEKRKERLQQSIDNIIENNKKINTEVERVCKGIECLEGMGKRLERLEKSSDEQCKGMECFKGFGDKLGKIEQLSEKKTYVCDNCGEDKLHALDHFCPGCGTQQKSWLDDSGNPVKGFVPRKRP